MEINEQQKQVLLQARAILCLLTDDPFSKVRANPMTRLYKEVMDLIAEIEAMLGY